MLACFRPCGAHAASRDGPASGGFDIYLCGAPTAKAAVREDLHELLSRERLTVRLQDVTSIDPARIMQQGSSTLESRGQVWLDLAATASDRATIYIRDRTPSRMTVRTVMLPTGWDEIAREELSHIVAASLDALASGAPLDGPTVEAPAPPPTAAASKDEASTRAHPTSFSFGASAALGRSPTGHSNGAAFGLSSLVRVPALHPRAGIWIDLAYVTAGSTGTSVMDLKLRGGSLAVLPSLSLARGAWAELRAGLGGVVTLMTATPRVASVAGGVEAGAGDVAWEAAIRATVRMEATWRSLRVFLAPACDFALPTYRYVVAGDTSKETVAETVHWRPSLWLGLELERQGRR